MKRRDKVNRLSGPRIKQPGYLTYSLNLLNEMERICRVVFYLHPVISKAGFLPDKFAR